VVPVRPFKHNEYERYLIEATPYYFGVWGTFLAFLIFIFFFLFDKK
jgi:oligosaccharyltransferase complex subunit beta